MSIFTVATQHLIQPSKEENKLGTDAQVLIQHFLIIIFFPFYMQNHHDYNYSSDILEKSPILHPNCLIGSSCGVVL